MLRPVDVGGVRLAADLERLTTGIRALRIVRQCMRQGVDVGKVSSLAERIRDMKAGLDKEADKIHSALDNIDKAAPIAFERSHRYIASQAAEVKEIEDTLRQLSNLPLDELPASPGASPDTPATTPPVAETAQAGSQDGTGAFVRRVQQP